MSYSVIVLENKLLENIFALNLKVYTGTDSVSKDSYEEVAKLLEVMPGVELIVVNDKIGSIEMGSLVFNYVKKNSLNIPIIIIGASNKYDKTGDFDKFGTFLPQSTDIKTFIRTCARHLGITSKDMASKIVPEYLPIKIEYFPGLKTTMCELYSKMKGENSKQFDVYVQKDGAVEQSSVASLQESGEKNLYIESRNRIKFVNDYTAQMIIAALGRAVKDEDHSVLESSMAIVHEQIQEVGVEPAVIEMANKATEAVISMVKKQKEFRNFLAMLLSDTSSYSYQHMQIITYLTFHMIDKLDWGKAEHQDKLAYAAVFHDVALKGDEQAMISSTEQLNESDLEEKVKEVVNQHAILGSKIIGKIPNAPYESDTIIKQHHGSKNGIGFPETIPGDLNRLSILFYVAHEYAENILRLDGDEKKLSHNDMIMHLGEKYTQKSFQAIIKALGWLLLKKPD